MKADKPRKAIEIIDKAFEEADIDTLVSMYDPAAVQVRYMKGSDKGESRGPEEFRKLYSELLTPGRFKVEQLRENLIETDGIALFTSRWRIEVESADPVEYIATVVLRRQEDGNWKDLIDTGPSILD